MLGIFLTITASDALAEHARRVRGQFLVKFNQRQTTAAIRSTHRKKLGVNLVRAHGITGAQLVRAKDGATFDDAYAKKLLEEGKIEYIEPNYVVSINATPNDSRYSELWGMNNTGQSNGTSNVDIDAPEAWNLTTGSQSVVVGVIDTGIDYNHPDLSANMWRNPGEIAGNGVDDDQNGVIDDYYGANFISASSSYPSYTAGNPMDDNNHGTHCAGTIGGVGNNATGVTGVNWNVKIMALKFLSGSGSGTLNDAVEAIEYAVRMKQRGVNIRVLSNSWGGGDYMQSLQDAITAANNAGILFVAAAGNSSTDTDAAPSYPSSYDVANVVSVAAIDRNGNLASFSNYGYSSVDLAAPGVDILSSTRNNSYSSFSGTSMATPHVSGVAALVLAREDLSVSDLKARLLGTVKVLPSLTGVVRTGGMVNAYNALLNAVTIPPDTSVPYTKSAVGIDYDSSLGERVLNSDDGYVVKDLGFPFPYYNTDYPRLIVSANGRVVPAANGQDVPTTPDYQNRLYTGINAYNDDLYPSPLSSGGVYFKTDGSVATITWVVVSYAHRVNPAAQAEQRIQAKLYSSGKIEIHYLDTATGDANYDYGKSSTVGISSVNGQGTQVLVSNNATNSAELGSGKALRFTQGSRRVKVDFDKDEISDLAIWQPEFGMWYVRTSSKSYSSAQTQSYQLGLPGDTPKLGDFDGDGKTDLAVWRPASGTWYFRTSGSGYSIITSLQWGLPGDTPLTADYDGDGVSDITVFRPRQGFFTLLSSGGFNRSGALTGSSQSMTMVPFTDSGLDPVVGDFSGQGKDNYTTVWQLLRFWAVKNSNNQLVSSLPWGVAGDTPLGCDWNGDGVSDRIQVRVESNNNRTWYVATSNGGADVLNFGVIGDVVSCDKDFDGDGKGDPTLYRPSNGTWYIRKSADNSVTTHTFGQSSDVSF